MTIPRPPAAAAGSPAPDGRPHDLPARPRPPAAREAADLPGPPDPFRAAFGPAELDPWHAFARTRVEARAKWAAIAQAAAKEKP